MKVGLKLFLAILFLGMAFNNVKGISDGEVAGCAVLGGIGGCFTGLALTAGTKDLAIEIVGVTVGTTLGGLLGYCMALEATPKRRMERGIAFKNNALSSPSLKRYFLVDAAYINSQEFLRFVSGNRIGSRWALIDEEKSLISARNELFAGSVLLEKAYKEDATLENNCLMHIAEINYLVGKINSMLLILTSSVDYNRQLDRLQEYEIEQRKIEEERRKNYEKERAKQEELRLRSESNAIKRQALHQPPAPVVETRYVAVSPVLVTREATGYATTIRRSDVGFSGLGLSQITIDEIKSKAEILAKEIIKDLAGANFGKVKKENIIRDVTNKIASDVTALMHSGRFVITQYQGVDLQKKVKDLILEYLCKLKLYPTEECSVCMEKFNNKNVRRIYLPCGHDICKDCLKQLPTLVCPICRESFSERFKSLEMDVEYSEPTVAIEQPLVYDNAEPSAPPVPLEPARIL